MASKHPTVKDILKEKLTVEELSLVPRSFDVIGSIIVLELPEELKKKEKQVGEAFLKTNKNVKTVCARAGIHGGEFRVRPVRVIAGDKNTETEHVESGARMHLDISKVYFTPRLSHERERITALVKDNEVIGNFFAGVGPFGLVIAKKNPNTKIYAIELNPDAYKYLEENIRINRCQEIIIPILGDVRIEAPKLLTKKCNRIVMPLPKTGETFLSTAFKCAAKKCVIHFYHFGPAEEAFKGAKEIVIKEANKAKCKVKIVNERVVRPFSPSVVQVVLDVKVL